MLGHERAFRERLVSLARLQPGESVLDVGCGTGSLALAAARAARSTGRVFGVDASPEMVARAARKARKARRRVELEVAGAQALPFPGGRFDVVLSTLMLHHLPAPSRRECMGEIRRVLRPGGRVLAVDFGTSRREAKGLLARVHRHGGVPLEEIVALVEEAGFAVAEKGPVGVRDLNSVLAYTASR